VILATTNELLGYLADVIERAERYGATVAPPYGAPDVEWTRSGNDLLMDLDIRPLARRQATVQITLRERWRPAGSDRWELAEYGYEVRDYELDYRRALHQHDVDYFVRRFGVASHEHCEAAIGRETCGHYAGTLCYGALDGLERLYVIWTTGTRPDCSQMRCLQD
jgi:hypothetical protein